MQKYKQYIVALALVAMLAAPAAHAQTSSSDLSDLIARLRSLVEQMKELQLKIIEVKTEVREELRVGLKEGMTDEDIKKIQEILATDRSIYPEGLVTGYFGPLTKNALKRFQLKFELEATGELDEDTREYLEELLQERFGDNIPPGLLTAPGIRKKVELRLMDGCDNSGRGTSPLCKKLKDRDDDDDDDDDDDNDDDKDEAKSAIDDAKDTIEDLEDTIDETDEDEDGYEEAVDKLEEAEDLLEEAEDAYDDKDYGEAKDKAEEAKSVAKDGLEAID